MPLPVTRPLVRIEMIDEIGSRLLCAILNLRRVPTLVCDAESADGVFLSLTATVLLELTLGPHEVLGCGAASY